MNSVGQVESCTSLAAATLHPRIRSGQCWSTPPSKRKKDRSMPRLWRHVSPTVKNEMDASKVKFTNKCGCACVRAGDWHVSGFGSALLSHDACVYERGCMRAKKPAPISSSAERKRDQVPFEKRWSDVQARQSRRRTCVCQLRKDGCVYRNMSLKSNEVCCDLCCCRSQVVLDARATLLDQSIDHGECVHL